MKNPAKLSLLTIFLSASLLCLWAPAKAQTFEQDANALIDDANTILNAYLEPFGKAFGNGINNGWYNTAKPHKTLGFDLTLTVNAVLIPDADLNYNFNELGLSRFTLNGGDGTLPTFFGDDASNGQINILTTNPLTGQLEPITTEDAPGGIGFSVLPVPIPQVGIGLIKNTDIHVRYLPRITIPGAEDVDIQLFGVALRHDIKQWIPGLKFLPFSMSVMGGYTSMSITQPIEVNPPSDATNDNPADYSTQEFSFTTTGFTGQLLISKKFLFITPYAALGYNTSTTTMDVSGNFPIPLYREDPNNPLTPEKFILNREDPIELEFNSSGVRATVGLKVSLGPITLHGDYTFQEYAVATAGLGFSIR